MHNAEDVSESASREILSEIKRLERRLGYLRRLATNPPRTPRGFHVARVIGRDGDADDGAYLEVYPMEFVVVSDCLGDEVYVKLLGSRAFAGETERVYEEPESGWELPDYGCWGRLPEEAVEAFPKAIVIKEEQLLD